MIESPMIAKLLGILGGTLLALVFIPPRTVSGFVRRTIAAIVFGFFFGHIVLAYLEWAPTDENITAAWAIASFSSWYLMGISRKVMERLSTNYES